MYNLNDLKNSLKNKQSLNNCSNLEKIVLDFLTPEISLLALAQAKELTSEEILEGLNNYYDHSTSKMFLSLIQWSNIDIFLKSDNLDIKEKVLEWLTTQDNFLNIEGQINPENKNFKVVDKKLKSTLESFKFSIDLTELEGFAQQLLLLEESLNDYFNAKLVWQGQGFKMVVGNSLESTTDRVNFWNEKLIKPIQAVTMGLLIFSTTNVWAGDADTKSAVQHATKAVMAQPEVKKTVDQAVKGVEQAAIQAVKKTGTEIPVTVIGYGIKAVTEQKVQVKGKVPLSLSSPVDYDLAIGFDSSYQMGVGGKNPYLQDSTYKIKGTKSNSEQRIEMQINFEF